MKNLFVLLIFSFVLLGCVKKSEKINIHIINNRSNIIRVEFRAGNTVSSATYVPANNSIIDEAYPGEYDVYVSNWDGVAGTDGPFVYHSHGLFYGNDEYITIN